MKKKVSQITSNTKYTEFTKICIYQKNKNGMGGVAIEEGSNIAITISSDKENFALDGDKVEVKCYQAKSQEWLGFINTILLHNVTHLVGTIITHNLKYFLSVNNPKFGNYFVELNNVPANFSNDELFNSIITSYPTSKSPYFIATILNSIGKIGDDVAFMAQILIETKAPTEFSEAAIQQAHAFKIDIEPQELNNRVDLRHLNFVTIDGEDAKDFDDAVYCELIDDNYYLFVAIADVSHYVTHASPLDIDAYNRGTSIYFPNKVIPMLPEVLSNGLCSLIPNVDRLAECCKMKINQQGQIIDYEIFNTVINSKARLTYNQVQTWLNDNTQITPDLLKTNIINLYTIFKLLHKNRAIRGAIDFETHEPFFIFNEKHEVESVIAFERLEAHKLIEECMLAANVSVADFMLKHHHPCLFRIHEKPSEDKFNNLKIYLNSLAIPFDISYITLTPKDYAVLLDNISTHPQFEAIQQTVLRSMQLAIYSPNNIGHFGLSYDKYLHFTSPIRRYPDLLTHRVIKKILNNATYDYSYPLANIGEQTSFTERRAEDLERKMDAFYKCQYAKTHIGKTFIGAITAITNFGLFIYISQLMLDGLLHIKELGNDYFIFDSQKQLLTGKKTGIQYHLGQEINVEIAYVDMAKLFIDFVISDTQN